jgi:hypothetical protein
VPTGRHFPTLIYDDAIVPAPVTSGEMIEKTTNVWDISQNLGTADGAIQVIRTRYHLADTYSSREA